MSLLDHASSIRSLPVPTDYLKSDQAEFRENYNLNSFQFKHSLHESPLFEIPRILELAKIMIERGDSSNFAAVNFKEASVDAKIRNMPFRERLVSAVENLDKTGSWIRLTQAHSFDPEYAALLTQLLSEIEALAGRPIKQDITWSTMTLFLSSPGITTPFHVDHETNFLFQIKGSKQLCVFDAADRELVPYTEIENFYSGNGSAANYKAHLQDRGVIYEMSPGTVVHHPPLAPHWVKNSDNISVSLSVACCMKPLERTARIHQANFILRKLGLKPKPPGADLRSDALKARVISALEKRSPRSYQDIVYGPMDRIKAPIKGLMRLAKPKS